MLTFTHLLLISGAAVVVVRVLQLVRVGPGGGRGGRHGQLVVLVLLGQLLLLSGPHPAVHSHVEALGGGDAGAAARRTIDLAWRERKGNRSFIRDYGTETMVGVLGERQESPEPFGYPKFYL